MSYDLKIIQKPNYLHFIITGENTKENVSAYLSEILNECVAQNCLHVLIEERLEGQRLNAFDIFSVVSQAAMDAIGKLKTIAFVDINAEESLMHFAETVAVNRSLPAKVFLTISEAENWIKKKTS